jgi:hypothetical protein
MAALSARARRVSLAGIAAALVAVALVTAALRVDDVVRLSYDALTAPAESPQQRDLGFVFGWQSRMAMTSAANVIPEHAVYTVVLGDSPPLEDAERLGIVSFAQYWLLPRRYTSNLADAQWVIAYHHSSETIGVRYRKEIPLAPYVNTFEVVR